jgi:TetR/AcrR family transcriptional regulator of autoinduction and epiphytic fitness
MLDCARALFVAEGYPTTTMNRIADDAGVAVQTVYYTFKTKGRLLCELVEVTAAGHPQPPPVTERPWMQQMLSARSGPRVLALAVERGTDIYERVAPLWPSVNAAAAADPEVAHYWHGVTADRRAGQGRMVARLAELGALRPGLDPDHATDLVVVLFGHDVYHGLVTDAGWPVPAYKAWVFKTLVQQLLRSQRSAPSAVADLTFSHLVAKT